MSERRAAVRAEYAGEEAENAAAEALQGIHRGGEPVLTVSQVEEIARRVVEESRKAS